MTLEDVDAELAPRGLRALEWDMHEPAWIGRWFPSSRHGFEFKRVFLVPPERGNCTPNMHFATVFGTTVGAHGRLWTSTFAIPGDDWCTEYDHPTPEAAQAACEAAIVAAWRNR
jgi:hypothetical protein